MMVVSQKISRIPKWLRAEVQQQSKEVPMADVDGGRKQVVNFGGNTRCAMFIT